MTKYGDNSTVIIAIKQLYPNSLGYNLMQIDNNL